MRISFDFDDTLAEFVPAGYGEILIPIPTFVQILKEYHALGCDCIILTARSNTDANCLEIESFLKNQDAHDCVSEIHFTNHEPKGPYAVNLGVKLHYDDSDMHIQSLKDHGIAVVDSRI